MRFTIQAVKDFLLKQSLDFDSPNINLYDFHPQLCILLAINGIFFNKKNSFLRFVLPVTGISVTIVGLSLELIFIVHYLMVKEFSYATECFCYAVILGTVPVVYSSLAIHTNKLHVIVEKMNQEFINICKLGPMYRHPFLKGQLLIWQMCIIWFVFVVFVSSLFAMLPIGLLCYQSLFATQDEHTIRPLQFRIWLPYDDPYRTPNYEIFLMIETFLCFCFVKTFCVYVYTLFHILLHYYSIMDMILLDFEVIFEDLEESVALLPRYDPRRIEIQLVLNKRVGNIVNMHLSVLAAVKTVSSVYGPALVYQVMFSPIAICLIAYQIREKLGNGTVDILFILLGIAACLQLWIPCYLGTKIRNKAFDVGDACWNCGWHFTSLGLLIRSDIVIILLRAQRPVTIKFTGLPNVQLETFSALMSKSYSYFNMLRQYT